MGLQREQQQAKHCVSMTFTVLVSCFFSLLLAVVDFPHTRIHTVNSFFYWSDMRTCIVREAREHGAVQDTKMERTGRSVDDDFNERAAASRPSLYPEILCLVSVGDSSFPRSIGVPCLFCTFVLVSRFQL